MSAVPGPIQDFISSFYAASDVGPSGHDAYVSHYIPECTLIMGPTEFKDHEGIRKFREAGWEKVATRKHIVKGVFTSPERTDSSVMLYGTVDYGMKDGTSKTGIEWAALMQLAKGKDDGKLKLEFYQVWIRG